MFNKFHSRSSKCINKCTSVDSIVDSVDVFDKIFTDKMLFDFEIYIIVLLDKLKFDIIPEILYIDDNLIKYNFTNIFSLRKIFNDKSINFHHLINELLSFFKIFKKNKIISGNLNIDNIYVNKKTLKCYITDLSNVNFIDKETNIDFQSLYISLLENNVENSVIQYMDNELNIFNTINYNKKNFITNLIKLSFTPLKI